METIKTAVVVVLLLAVLYGVFVVLNKPDLATPPELADWNEGNAATLDVDLGTANEADGLQVAPPTAALSVPPSAPSARGESPAWASAANAGSPGALASSAPEPVATEPAEIDAATAGPAPAQGLATSAPTLADPPAREGPSAAVELSDPAALQGRSPAGAPSAAIDDPGNPAPTMIAPTSVAMGADPRTNAQRSIYGQLADQAGTGGAEPSGAATNGMETAGTRGSGPETLETGGYGSGPDRADFRSIRAFDNAWNSAIAQLQKGQWAEALLTLSLFYHDPDVTAQERQRLLDLLDPLAGRVIYSAEHTMEMAYQVRPGDQLEMIARQYQLPVRLLQNINGIAQPQLLEPGVALKVLRGPFRAEIDLKNSELALFLGKYYAGRFVISVGNDPAPQPTECQLLAIEPGREYIGQNGLRIPAGAAGNPYGNVYLDLGNGLCIHGSPDTVSTQAGLGCISLSNEDAIDIASILSLGSHVVIR